MRTIKLFGNFFEMEMKRLMEYRMDFVLGIFPMLFTQLAGLMFLKIVFLNISDLSGWGFYECMLIYGFYITVSSIEEMLFGNLRGLKGYVFSGEFDLILLKPIRPVLHLMMLDFDGNYLFQTVLGVVIIGYSAGRLDLTISLGTVVFTLFAVITGVLFLSSLTILMACIYFYTEGTFSLFNVMNTVKGFSKYPITIFSGVLGVILKWVLPISVVSYFPTMLLLKGTGREKLLYCIAGLVIMAVVFWVVNQIFYRSIENYQSTGN